MHEIGQQEKKKYAQRKQIKVIRERANYGSHSSFCIIIMHVRLKIADTVWYLVWFCFGFVGILINKLKHLLYIYCILHT